MFLCFLKQNNIYIKKHKNNNINGVITMTETKLHMTINADLKHKLKVIAAKKNMTMSEIVEELIRGYIQQEE